jgi:FAD/FMN-containing dehydrogenase
MKNFDSLKLSRLASTLDGKLITPSDDLYNEARTIWNAMIDRKPLALAQCINTEDVVRTVNFARDNDLLLSVKGGGHNVAGNAICDGGIVADLSKLTKVTVDRDTNRVKVGGGCLLSDLDKETQKYGLAVPGGIISHTGVAGLTLGGGFGWTSRKYGFSIDNLISAEIVTANGEILTASKNKNSDLFWAIRGGGGNFGIVTNFEFVASSVGPEVYTGAVVHPFKNAKKYLQFHREFTRSLPDEMTLWMAVRHAPPLPFLSEDDHGELVVIVLFLYLGDPMKGEKIIKPLRDFEGKLGEDVGINQFVEWQSAFDEMNAHGARNYWKSHILTDLSDGYIDAILDAAKKFPSLLSDVFIIQMGGAPSRINEDETAYAHRNEPFTMNIHTRWTDSEDDEKCIAWARELYEKTQPFAKGVYVNFLSEEGEARVKDAYSEEGWKKLVKIKTKYDPDNLFRMNQNIKPQHS